MEHTVKLAQPSGLLAAVAAPFKAVGRLMVFLAEANPRLAALDRLSKTTDEQLAARGLTRDGEVRRILGARAYI